MTVLAGLLGVVLGSVIGGIVTYLTTRSNMRLTLEHEYDKTLQTKRIERYEALFQASSCLPRYWPPTVPQPTREDLHQFRETFHDWYFGPGAGGMFLTRDAKDHYIRLLNTIAETAFKDYEATMSTSTEPLSEDEAKTLCLLSSDLRHQLATDVGAANPPRFRWARPGPLPPPPSFR